MNPKINVASGEDFPLELELQPVKEDADTFHHQEQTSYQTTNSQLFPFFQSPTPFRPSFATLH